ncbi:MAG: ATP-dependent DNA helicase RecQ [Clostridia bacterium]|nr:ATP-dependent DNA helicase RecQ [Clostridia bacterium]
MRIEVYKGFDEAFLCALEQRPLLNIPVSQKKNVLLYDKDIRKKLDIALLSLDEDDVSWLTYEEYSLIKNRIDDAITEDELEVVIFRNNLYPEYYPIEFDISSEISREIIETINGDRNAVQSSACQSYLAIYNSLVDADGTLYGGFYNYEYYRDDGVIVKDYYPQNCEIEKTTVQSQYDVFLNEDIDTYLRDLTSIIRIKPSIISIKSTNGELSKRVQKTLQAYCLFHGIRLIEYLERKPEYKSLDSELKAIAKDIIRINGFEEFRKIKFYKSPDINKEVVDISQSEIIHEIIRQAENAYNYARGDSYRDIFITASTGAGKSLMFQIPAVYLAQKYNKLTIIIEPVKALMQDQKEKLNKSGYMRVEAFNSDLITQVEKEAVLERIKHGDVDLLYLSPETLLSYSIETIIGEREIGLIIVDEAHIVTTWGVGFRPDYWYLGGYLNRLRNRVQTSKGMKQKVYHFPICAFTATAINGGVDDSVSDTIISLYMENPIKYLGYVRRDDVKFEITHPGTGQKLPKPEYESAKCQALDKRIQHWLKNDEKTIVYFPYASLARDASRGMQGFAGITTDKRIGTYTGRNIDDLSNKAFNEVKRQTFESFRKGTTPIMLATKAFGMGVDVNDVKNVYHYAVSGNLSDYVQEIGRAARKSSMEGNAVTDFFFNDMTFMKVLFGMSQIRQYQIKKVLEGIYDTYKSKKGERSFLISPEAFTYIFNGKNEGDCISKLKTCLLMLEKDFYDKYNFKVLISRPQSVFTKAFICINKESESEVLSSEYGKYMRFVSKGRYREKQPDGSLLSDNGDVYTLDLKSIWEEFHPNISFPQFKYWFFNANSQSPDKVDIMPSVRHKIAPRQKITIEARGEMLLSELRELILQDFEFIANTLYTEFKRQFFTTEEFTKVIREKYGITKARIIANSLFDLVDPDSRCVKHRTGDTSGKTVHSLSNGNFKEFMRRPIIRSNIMQNIARIHDAASYEGFISLTSDDNSNTALKLLSIFDYITYEVAGGEEPEIFIRLNDPNKVKSIVLGNTVYSNNYVTKAKQKHDRDVAVLLRFFNNLKGDEERWNYIEDYFLGYDVLSGIEEPSQKQARMNKLIDKEHSYPTNMYHHWTELESFFDEGDHSILSKLAAIQIPIPEYLETSIKHSDEGKDILMSWPTKDTLICQQDTTNGTLEYFKRKGWHAYRIYDIDYEAIKGDLE